MAGRGTDRITNQIAAADVGEEATAVARCMALPVDYPPVRVADTYSANETCIAQTVTKQKVTWDSGVAPVAGSGRQLPLNEWGAFVFPSLLRHQVVYTTLSPQAVAVSYRYQAFKAVNGTNPNFNVQTNVGTYTIEPAVFAALDTLRPHGPLLFCGKGDGRKGVWIDATADAGMNATIAITFNNAIPLAESSEFLLYQWNNGRWTYKQKVIIGPTAITGLIQVTESGYYSFSLTAINVTEDAAYPTTFTVVVTSRATSCWAHHPVNHLGLNLQNIGRNRVLGTSFLLQNEASVMNKQGNVVALQVPAGWDWYLGFAGNTQGFYATMFDDDNSSTFLLETGIYGFKRPKGSQDFDWEGEVQNQAIPTIDATIAGVGYTNTAYFDLSCPCDYLAIAASASALGAGDCLLSTGAGLEYTTMNSWLEKSTPVISENAFKLGIATLREVDQFYENPLHIPSLLDSISNGMRIMAPVVGLFPGIGPALAGALGTGGSIVSGVRRAVYGGDDDDAGQGQNQEIKQARNARKRQADLQMVVSDGRSRPRIRVKRRGM
jgi:hypothetical protein